MKLYMTKAYLTVINKIASVKENLKNNEDGMETVQAIILVVVGLVIVAVLVSIIGTSKDSGIFKTITDKLKEIGIET